LVIAPNLPYPCFSGFDLRVWQNVNALAKIGAVGVFGLCAGDPRSAEPAPRQVSFFRSTADAALAYDPSRGFEQNRTLENKSWLADPLGHPADLYYTEGAADEIGDLLSEFDPAIVLLEGLWMHRYIGLVKARGCRAILDCPNVEGSWSEEGIESAPGRGRPITPLSRILAARVKAIERNAGSAVAQIWACSHNDARLMESLYETATPIHVVPNGVDMNHYSQNRAVRHRASLEKTIIFPAMFAYPPNRLAAAFVLEEIFPLLAPLYPDCRLVLPGSWPTAQMMEAAQRDPRIVVPGPVRDMRPYFEAASAMIVPLF
jgi:hypothetical protein